MVPPVPMTATRGLERVVLMAKRSVWPLKIRISLPDTERGHFGLKRL